MPAGQRAAEAVAAHPEKSNRAIAEEIGPSEATVRRARDTGASVTQVDEKRIGRDGKTYSLEHGRKQVARLQKHYGDPASHSPLSALPPIADITESHWHVCQKLTCITPRFDGRFLSPPGAMVSMEPHVSTRSDRFV